MVMQDDAPHGNCSIAPWMALIRATQEQLPVDAQYVAVP